MGPIAYILKMRVTLLRDLGAPMSPFNAFLFLQGLETLPLRMRAHCANAVAAAKLLAEHPKVTRVIHPSLMTGEARRRADAYLKGGYGGLLGFELQGGREAGRRFIDALQMFYHVANIGDSRSLAIHPASTTHSQLSPEEQEQTGVTDSYVRLSIGIEHPDDILADLRAGARRRLSPRGGPMTPAQKRRRNPAAAGVSDRPGTDRRQPRLGGPRAVALGSRAGLLARGERIGGELGTVAVAAARARGDQSSAGTALARTPEPEIGRRVERWLSADWDPAEPSRPRRRTPR